jgi:hypothetical protein
LGKGIDELKQCNNNSKKELLRIGDHFNKLD